jgi:trimethylamine--corrinoid protein Co-methyltransferase
MRNYNSIAGEAMWVDDRTMERRYATLDDVRTAARLGDALDGINVVGAMADPAEIPVSYRCVAVAAEQLKNTTKPITFWFHDRASARFVLELFTACAESEEEAKAHPYGYPLFEPISPLRFPRNGIDLLFETAAWPLPVQVGPMAQAGSSAPVTLAGTLAQENAEILAGVCVTQLIRPGTPVCYGGIPHAFDMRTTQMIFAGPEQALMAVAMTQMGVHYGLPVYINVGLTDAKVPDAQAGIEAGITLQLGALAGANIFGHLGICGVDQATSLAMLVFQNELIGYVERVMRRFEVDDDSLALDVIARVAQSSGSFLAEMHTAERFRDELWFPKLLDREFFQAWGNSFRPGLTVAVARCGTAVSRRRSACWPSTSRSRWTGTSSGRSTV